MRVIGGSLGSRRFDPPKRFEGRPTTDYAREGLFNVLNNEIDIEGLKALDLFAGTGGISFELASRGADKVTSVDSQSVAVNHIRKVALDWDIDDIIEVFKIDVLTFAEVISQPYDLIFADPPFDADHFTQIHERFFNSSCLNSDGMMVLEHGPRTDLSSLAGFDRSKRYGHVHFSFFYPNY